MRIALVVAFAALPLAACDNRSEPAQPAADATATDTAAPSSIPEVTPTAIPAAMQGRWGLTAADCEPGRPDAKGLLTISANKLEFYESVGTLDDIEEAGANRIRADFDFTGEGMTWERDLALELQDGGQTLFRREFGEEAAPDAFRYTKCS